uniref:Uncharacterized protein n=1 Tax=Phakopsora pachyrhizi TaxID=170000 RepID=A0A0S1MKM5_PHAPC
MCIHWFFRQACAGSSVAFFFFNNLVAYCIALDPISMVQSFSSFIPFQKTL